MNVGIYVNPTPYHRCSQAESSLRSSVPPAVLVRIFCTPPRLLVAALRYDRSFETNHTQPARTIVPKICHFPPLPPAPSFGPASHQTRCAQSSRRRACASRISYPSKREWLAASLTGPAAARTIGLVGPGELREAHSALARSGNRPCSLAMAAFGPYGDPSRANKSRPVPRFSDPTVLRSAQARSATPRLVFLLLLDVVNLNNIRQALLSSCLRSMLAEETSLSRTYGFLMTPMNTSFQWIMLLMCSSIADLLDRITRNTSSRLLRPLCPPHRFLNPHPP